MERKTLTARDLAIESCLQDLFRALDKIKAKYEAEPESARKNWDVAVCVGYARAIRSAQQYLFKTYLNFRGGPPHLVEQIFLVEKNLLRTEKQLRQFGPEPGGSDLQLLNQTIELRYSNSEGIKKIRAILSAL